MPKKALMNAFVPGSQTMTFCADWRGSLGRRAPFALWAETAWAFIAALLCWDPLSLLGDERVTGGMANTGAFRRHPVPVVFSYGWPCQSTNWC